MEKNDISLKWHESSALLHICKWVGVLLSEVCFIKWLYWNGLARCDGLLHYVCLTSSCNRCSFCLMDWNAFVHYLCLHSVFFICGTCRLVNQSRCIYNLDHKSFCKISLCLTLLPHFASIIPVNWKGSKQGSSIVLSSYEQWWTTESALKDIATLLKQAT